MGKEWQWNYEKRTNHNQTSQKQYPSSTARAKHLIAEINKTIAECDKAIDSIIEADEELKENYAIITSIKGVAGKTQPVCWSTQTTSKIRI